MPIDAVVFDLDGTLVRYHGVEFESSWGAVAAAAGVAEASDRLLREYLPRRDAYPEWVAKDAELLTGIRTERVMSRIFPAPYAAGVRTAVAALRGRHRLGILSSGVDFVADWVREDLGFDFSLANHIEIADGRFTGRSETRVDLWAKDEAMRRIAGEQGISLGRICFVGDHVNDLPVMRIVGLAIAANPKDERLRDAADHVIDDFAALPGLVAAHAGERANGS
jgi:phosphoserine phosphatase